MRPLYIFMFSFLSTALLHAQVIDNGGFETWTTGANYSEPDGWLTSNQETGNISGGVAVLADSAAYSGTLAAQVRTVYIGIAPAPYAGILTNGSYDTLGVSGPAINYKPQKLTGYYKYSSSDGDSALVVLFLNKYSTVLGKDETVASATIKLPAAATWTYFEGTVFDAFQAAPDPESFAIVILSTKDVANPLDGDLHIDALEFSGVSSVNDPVLDAELDVYPNPTTESLTVKMGSGYTVDELTVYNGLGQIALHQLVENNTHMMMDVSSLPAGVHVLQIKLSGGKVLNRTIQIIH